VSFEGRRAGFADLSVVEDALVAVEPAVGAPNEAVQAFVGVLVAEAIKEDLGFAVGFVVAVFVGDKEEVGRGTDPDAAETEFEAADEIQAFGENFAGLEFAVGVGVFENDDFIEPLAFGLTLGITVSFRHPDTAALVESESDGLVNIGLGDDGFGFKTGRQIHLSEGVLGGIRGRMAEVVFLKVAEDGAGVEALEVRERVFSAKGESVGEEDDERKADEQGHREIKAWR
jgi:hypothetical protein